MKISDDRTHGCETTTPSVGFTSDAIPLIQQPLIVPYPQIESFRIICASKVNDIVVLSNDVSKFKEGQLVRI